MLPFRVALWVCLGVCFVQSPAHGQTTNIRSLISVSTIEVSAALKTKKDPNGRVPRIYVASRPDSSAEVVWARATDDMAVWTSLDYGAAGDTRRVPDIMLAAANRTLSSGMVALPAGGIAVVSAGEPELTWGIKKYLREFDEDGTLRRDVEIPSGEVNGGGWTSRMDELYLGFWGARNQIEYTVVGETTGGGHYGSRVNYLNFQYLERFAVQQTCSHNLASSGVWNHQQQLPGLWCMQDGFGGIYQLNSRLCRTYAFHYAYGYATFPLGDVVPYKEGFLLTMGGQRDTQRYDDSGKFDWAESTGYENEVQRTDVGIIWQPYENGFSIPCCVTWLMDTPDKMESSVHAAWLGVAQEELLVFYVEHDSKADGGSTSTAEARYMVQSVNPEPIRQYYLEWMARSNPAPKSYPGDTCPTGCGNPTPVLNGAAEDIGDTVDWEEHQTFTSFPNGDIGWAANFETDAKGDVVDHAEPPDQTNLKLVRLKYAGTVDGGWTEWGPCDCDSLLRKRVCAKPVPVNDGAPCSGVSEETCEKSGCAYTSHLPISYPPGHDPVLQDPSGGAWLQNKGGCPTYIQEGQGCLRSPGCCAGPLACFERDDSWATCLPSCSPGVYDSISWSCLQIPCSTLSVSLGITCALCDDLDCGSHGTCHPESVSCKCSEGYTGDGCQDPPAEGSFYWDVSGYEPCPALCGLQDSQVVQSVVCKEVTSGGNVDAADTQCDTPSITPPPVDLTPFKISYDKKGSCRGTVYYGKQYKKGKPGAGAKSSFNDIAGGVHSEKGVFGDFKCNVDFFGEDITYGYYGVCFCNPSATVSSPKNTGPKPQTKKTCKATPACDGVGSTNPQPRSTDIGPASSVLFSGAYQWCFTAIIGVLALQFTASI